MMPQVATKPAITDPLAEAEAERESAHAEAAAVAAKITKLTRAGPGFDQIEHQRLMDGQESALKKLRAADLQIEELRAAATAPISARALDKVRIHRRKAFDEHASMVVRMAETNRVREHLGSLRGAIEKLRGSPEFIHDERELRRVFRGDAGAHAATTRSGKRLAALERDLDRCTAEAALAAAAQAAAQEKWQGSKATLDNWEQAIRSQGRAAAHALSELPKVGTFDDQNSGGHADISLATPHALHQSQRSLGR